MKSASVGASHQNDGVSSDNAVYSTIRKGVVERGVVYVSAGLLTGGLASIVLARGGGGARKVITAFGGGIGLGSAWTRTSMDLEEMLEKK